MTPGPRRLYPLAAGLLAGALLLSCGGEGDDERPTVSPTATVTASATSVPERPTATPTPTPPEPTPAATTPATPSPTATPGDPAATIVPAFPDLPELERPIALIDAPERSIFLIVLQEGRVLSVPRDGPYDEPRTVHDQRDRTACCGEEGLLSLALDPDFASNGYVYAYYSTDALGRVTRLSRFATTGAGEAFAFDDASELVVLEVAQPWVNHNGGTVLFGSDGMLYLGYGDGGAANDPFGHGQNPGTLLGTVIRIDVRDASPERPYAIPPDNPFLDRDGVPPEVWAYGLRNPWRMSFDRETGLLWVGDVGQNEVEEVSVVVSGGNYGWNVMEGSRCFDPAAGLRPHRPGPARLGVHPRLRLLHHRRLRLPRQGHPRAARLVSLQRLLQRPHLGDPDGRGGRRRLHRARAAVGGRPRRRRLLCRGLRGRALPHQLRRRPHLPHRPALALRPCRPW